MVECDDRETTLAQEFFAYIFGRVLNVLSRGAQIEPPSGTQVHKSRDQRRSAAARQYVYKEYTAQVIEMSTKSVRLKHEMPLFILVPLLHNT